MKKIVFIDTEVSTTTNKVLDFGAIKEDGEYYHGNSGNLFSSFIEDSYFIVGHNIINHDSRYIGDLLLQKEYVYIDTLTISPLIYPKKIYHHLLKDDKLVVEECNNPLNDSKKARDLFYCEVEAFERLPNSLKNIYGTLLNKENAFKGFFEYVKWQECKKLSKEILKEFKGIICENVNLEVLINEYPVELAYALSLSKTTDKNEIVSPFVYLSYPKIEKVMKLLRATPCSPMCKYCKEKFNPRKKLKDIFGYDDFRKFNGENLQEKAVTAAIEGKSLLAVFPTGGGKSLTFQLPALIEGEASRGLTIVISPLQSLMKDQVDSLAKKGIIDAVTINGMLNMIERKEAIDRVMNGKASLLYVSPELLRSKTIERMLLARTISRIVIDEAHCFSSWGQDFRVDYLYIADFIKNLEEKKKLEHKIPVSCFTATAKQKVISDICDYFKEKLGINLEIFATSATRMNLRYKVELKDNLLGKYASVDEEKYDSLRKLILEKKCPTIVYVSRTKKTIELAEKLSRDGINALPFNGKMESDEKANNQDKFIRDDVQVIVATSAFGMGIDKSDVKLVVHYEISDSLENYVQEAGRAGRDQNIEAECVVYFNEKDLDKHFSLLRENVVTFNEIRQVFRAIKYLTSKTDTISLSALEIGTEAGWVTNGVDVSRIEMRVKTAIAALEDAGYIKRGMNSPRVYATSLHVKSVIEAREKIEKSNKFDIKEIENAVRIMSALISIKSNAKAGNADNESRVDYLSEVLNIDKKEIVRLIDKLREINILADQNDMKIFISEEDKHKIDTSILKLTKLERFLIDNLGDERTIIDLKVLNDAALKEGIKKSTVGDIKKILFYWQIKGYIKKVVRSSESNFDFNPVKKMDKMTMIYEKRSELAKFITEYLFEKSIKHKKEKVEGGLSFSIVELVRAFNNRNDLFASTLNCEVEDVEEAILYLEKTKIMTINGGFLVFYTAMQIKRLIMDNKIQYKIEDYRKLKEHYNLKAQQIHIVGEFANIMLKDYHQALTFVSDYFSLPYEMFIKKYFKGNRKEEIMIGMTPQRYKKLFEGLSEMQKKIMYDDNSKYISIIAGPGSGKTKVLVHKLASLLLLEEVKAEQLLMLTFSRAAATEFKTRLLGLIDNAAHFVDIKTFHSYCFDLLGKLGDETEFDKVIEEATKMIENGEVEQSKIAKRVLVIDEAQDMDEKDYMLVKALIDKNPDMRVIAVGDDDQTVYEFRDSSPQYLRKLTQNKEESKQYDLLDNYRSDKNIVGFANAFASSIKNRLKNKPIKSVKDEDGYVGLIKHESSNLEEAVVTHVLNNKDKSKKIAILTRTNEEALKVLCLLNKRGVSAKLIQSNDGFHLSNLLEIREFKKYINEMESSPIISDEVWKEACKKIITKFSTSSSLNIVTNLISRFAKTKVGTVKYKTDFNEFVRDSKYEEFIDYENERIVISTIHKSKGREFDSVYMLLNKYSISEDSDKRVLYVGMTRAKSQLFIHYNNDIFDRFKYMSNYYYDKKIYNEPEDIVLQLTHKDVWLGSFESPYKTNLIKDFCGGDKLAFNEDFIYVLKNSKFKNLFKLSKRSQDTLQTLKSKGYSIVDMYIRFIVYWKDNTKPNSEECLIILPDIHMKKKSR